MADDLKELYNEKPGLLSMFMDPHTIKSPASWAAYNQLGGAGESGGDTDALRHLLGAATLARRQGPSYAQTALNWHENPNIPVFLGGGHGQPEYDRTMDVHNNALGMQIGATAKSYDEALNMAMKLIKEKKVKLAEDRPPPQEKPKAYDPIDEFINSNSNKLKQFGTWASKYFKK
jgi:hypothetical protein